ncbi:class I fructose-bisphosphate aldolase [Granulosicoccus antarcticus]|uniref:Fructose-bisphosphate aldolase n=1 Tax=Granulosicoccus antarcticus IMCC3135 TaxID=1192854 RepID=A0A2Z2NLC8_9GAMM|nr:class I fructose-bisphosphate aldolase [Granulosicoccus antarcticus]ASJ72252.1 hypothetical protein IMCC3135_10800 [Granulosicoccus antarcticus IMCC3135]
MNAKILRATAAALMADDKGLLAMDESNPTCNKRFAALGIPQTEEARRAWRELIITTPGLADSISGAILYDETIHQFCQAEVTAQLLNEVFGQLYAQGVLLEGMLLKPNMVLSELACSHQNSVDRVADATVIALLRAVPAAVPGIAFLSGGQRVELAFCRLSAMNRCFEARLPWPLRASGSGVG